MTVYGYARVSTRGQDLQLQQEELQRSGATVIYSEKESGAKTDREELANLLEKLESGDTLIVTKADRIARSIVQLREVVEELCERGVTVNILNMGVFSKDSIANPITKLLFNVLGSFAEFERDMIITRTSEGRERARARGVHLGMKKKHKIEGALLEAIQRVENGTFTQREGADFSKCSIATFKRRLAEYRAERVEE